MHSKNELNNQENNRSFIEKARRTQIIDATIDVLAEYGYVDTSFVRIAKQAGISASLISYHFNNKDELTLEVYRTINQTRVATMQAAVSKYVTATDKLSGVIEADLTYMGTHPNLFKALVEVLFSVRNSKGFLELMETADQQAVSLVENILQAGQKNGEFGEFDSFSMALIIDGARDQFLAQLPDQPKYNLTAFTRTLTSLVLSYVKKGTR